MYDGRAMTPAPTVDLATLERIGQGRAGSTTLRAAGLAAVKLILHLSLAGRYGYNGDELYFIACGKRAALGYVDHPPLVPWIARASGALFGPGLIALRFPSAIVGALAVLVTMLLTRQWGGGAFAQVLAGLAMIIAPAYLRMGSILCIPVFEPLLWTLAAYCIVLAIRRERSALWIAAGVVAGLGLLAKHTMLLWGAGLALGMLATKARRHLVTPWPWLAGLMASLIFLPNLLWQWRHGWPTLEFLRGINEDQLNSIPRALFLLGQLVYMHPFTLPLVVAGLAFFFSAAGEPHRMFGWLWIAALCILFATHAKPYYLAPAYPLVFAAGATRIELWLAAARHRWLRYAVLGAMTVGGVALAPIALPILPLQKTDALVARVLGSVLRSPADLTLEFHEEFGWPEQAHVVAKVYASLTPADQQATTILTHDYTQASAINFFGRNLGLPRAVSGHMTYHLWGPDRPRADVVIAYGFRRETLEALFGDVTALATISHPLASSWQQNLSVYLCRSPKAALSDAWPRLKRYRFSDRAAPRGRAPGRGTE